MTSATLVRPVPHVARPHQAVADRWAARLFGAAVVVALPLLLWFGREHWFYLDEWQILGADGVSNTGYFDGHNGHWITLLRLEYRLNFALWGLRSYVPYQVPVILTHLAAAVLLRQLIRQCGVRDWIATATALAFLFFGSGRVNMTLGFQASLTGSLVCGYALFLLADGPRRVTGRDWLALGLGVVGLMTSSVFVAVLVGFGVTTLLRRGVRIAAFYAVPLGVIYTAWYVTYGRNSTWPTETSARAARYGGRVLWDTFKALADGWLGLVLVAVAIFGLGTAVIHAWRSGTWGRAAVPLGLAVSSVAFVGMAAIARAATWLSQGSPDRFLHVGAALLLPLVAVGAEELAQRRTLLAACAIAPLAVGLPSNLNQLSHTSALFRTDRELALAVAHSPLIDRVPPIHRPLYVTAFHPPATAGWLERQAAAGRIPEPDEHDPVLDLTAAGQLALAQLGPQPDQTCPRLTAPRTMVLQRSDRVAFGGIIDFHVVDGEVESKRRLLKGTGGPIWAMTGPVEVVVRSTEGRPARLCAVERNPQDPSLDEILAFLGA
jgi:hypothetical protein